MTIGDRLKDFGVAKYGDITNFADNLGISVSNLSRYLHNRATPGNKLLNSLRSLGADVEYIMTGKKTIEVENVSKETRLPVLKEVYAGNSPYMYDEDNISDWKTIPSIKDPKCHFLLKVVGDSMTGGNGRTINDGDYVIVNTETIVSLGDVVVVKLKDGRALLKQFFAQTDNSFTLHSFNHTNYPDMIFEGRELEAMYRVVGIQAKTKWI